MKDINIKATVTCAKCKSAVWHLTILKASANKVIASEWISENPKLYKHGAPKDAICPLCGKFMAVGPVNAPRFRAIVDGAIIYL